MFDKAKNFMMRKMLERQLKNAPQSERDMIMTLFEKHPDLFQKISAEMQAEIKAGKSQMAAAMKVMPKYQTELQKAMGGVPAPKGGPTRFNPDGSIHQ